ncbi:response regulator [Oscillatoria acuminata]|uniref:histidine kinase n=1 Tax=Oscillatoria acuminata PCC 6304 TaxID=56110 RepID=K9TG44_9CYAN|nr:response regulator [Oscillatoria acuminata]AFY80999.1 bacteriophytochrome (light-regulated signal transduction histidine kinase) [Oscillatoria acuminata PCC 6304]
MPKQEIDWSKTDILIVDDTPDNLRVLSAVLEQQGGAVRKALNGVVALNSCEKQLPDLILLDIRMPEMDGYEVCRCLKSNPQTADIPVIFISALDSTFDKVQAFQEGGADYITKPFQSAEVMARIAYQLTIQQQQQQLAAQNAQLQQLNAELKRSNEDLEAFAYAVAHDLTSPLQTIVSTADLAEYHYQDCLGSKGRKYMEHIIQSALRMKQMMDSLLAYSKVGVDRPSFKPTSCKTTLEAALANLQEQIATSGATITHSELPTVMAESPLLICLFQNLISNGIKFCQPGILPVINISAQAFQENQWEIRVQDNGIGIAPKNFHRLFQMFQRLNTDHPYPGSGIGIALCKKIVERHGGQIWVESQVGVGTSFYFTLPSC